MKHPVPFRKTPLVLAITASLASPLWVQAAPGDPLGPEFRVNTFTTGWQTFPAVAMDAEGDFVVAWTSYDQDGSAGGIYAQRYTQAGVAQGPEFRVNTYTTGSQGGPTVAMDADGDFVVAWTSYGQDGSYSGIYAQRYNSAGVAQGVEFRVNTSTTDNQERPAVAMDADGDFVMAWTSYGDGHGWGVYAQRYGRAGVAQGPEFQVNTYTTQGQRGPTIALDADGDFVVAWGSYGLYYSYGYSGQDGSIDGIYAQRYDRAGVAQGAEFRVNTFTTSAQGDPTVAMDADGDFVVAWGSYGQDGSSRGIYAQRYAGPASGGTLTTVGLYDPTEGRFRLRNEHASGRADYNFRFGPTDSGTTKITVILRDKP